VKELTERCVKTSNASKGLQQTTKIGKPLAGSLFRGMWFLVGTVELLTPSLAAYRSIIRKPRNRGCPVPVPVPDPQGLDGDFTGDRREDRSEKNEVMWYQPARINAEKAHAEK